MIETTTQIIEISNTTPSMDIESVEYLQDKLALQEMLYRNGYSPSMYRTGDGDMWYRPNTTQVNNSNVSSDVPVKIIEELDPQTQLPTGKVKVEPIENTIKTNVSPMSVVMPCLSGAGIGYELYEEYPQFWSDLSDALFGSTTPLTDANYDTKTFIDVLIEANEDGGIKAYCDKRQVEDILKSAYDLGAFVSNSEFEPTITETGVYNIIPKGIDFDHIIGSIREPKPSDSLYQTAKAEFNNYVQSHNFNACVVSYLEEKWESYGEQLGRVEIHIDCYNINEDINAQFIKQGDIITIESGILPRFSNASYLLEYNYYTGTHRASGWTTTPVIGNTIYRPSTSPYIFSTINTNFIDVVEGLKHNTDLPTVTDRNNVFSNLGAWLENAISIPTLDPNTGEFNLVDFLPVSIDDIDNIESVEPTQQNQDKVQSGDITQTAPYTLPLWLSDFLMPSIVLPTTGTPAELPNGNTPVVVPPTNNNSSKLFTVYNPTGVQLDSLGAYLWSDNIATLIKELFANNRMDAIISLHQVYCTPSTTTPHNIILGNLDSGVSAKVVNNQYVSIDCGTQYIAEMYGDARDYLNVDCQVYLPFIGFRNVDPHDIINCNLRIKYTIDVYTGSCLAQLVVTKGGYTQTLYTFEGNCSVQIPLTGSDRARIIGAIASTVSTGIATGGVGAIAMGVGQVASGGAQSSIQRTSGFSGNCGAMAIKKPYIVMTRLKSADAVDYNKIVGNPTNKTVYLANCDGFTRVREIHLDGLNCTDEEKRMLYNILKQGIVL